jgi:hypothetical protein
VKFNPPMFVALSTDGYGTRHVIALDDIIESEAAGFAASNSCVE